MAALKNTKATVSIDPETLSTLEAYASDNGLKTANTLLAAAGIELAKAKKKGLNVWHVLARIAAEEGDEQQPRRTRVTASAPLEIAR